MHISNSIIVSALACFTIAAPTSLQQGVTFSLEAQPVSSNATRIPAVELLRVYNKFNSKAPAVLKAAAKVTESVNSTNTLNALYTVPLQIGNQTFNVQLDTGSSDLWVWSNLQPAAQRAGHNFYTPGSTATKMDGLKWNITYTGGQGGGGVVYSDKVQLGNMAVAAQAVEVPTSFKGFKGTAMDGILGMGFRRLESILPKTQPTLFDNIKASLARPLFTSKLRQDAAGTYDFGFIDSAKYTGNITYVDVHSPLGYWAFKAGSYSIGGKNYAMDIGHSIADTGTSLLALPTAIVSQYYAKVQGAVNSAYDGGWIFPCTAKLPAFHVNIGGTSFGIGGSNFKYYDLGTGYCYGGLQTNDGMPSAVFGDVFLRRVFTVWDQCTTPARLGFAKPT